MTTALQRGDVELLQDLVLEGHGKHLLGKTSWNEDVKTFLKELPSYLVSINQNDRQEIKKKKNLLISFYLSEKNTICSEELSLVQ